MELKITGGIVLIDKDDYELVSKYQWHLLKGYVFTRPRVNGRSTVIRMHRLINNTPMGFVTDHINHNKLDNRKRNLRTVKTRENQFNRSINKNSPFSARGVTKTPDKTFRVRLVKDRKKYNFGCYKTLDEALKVQANALKKLYRGWAC
jgi:hypothetical protein